MQNEGARAETARSAGADRARSAGSAAMYQAMTSLGFARNRATSGPIKLEGDPEGRLGPDPRRGPCRHDRGARTAQGRLQGPGARIQQPRRRPQLDAARRRQIHRARRRDARTASSIPGFTSIPARGGFPITTARCWITASGSRSRSNRSSSSITTPICTPRSAFGGKPQRIRDVKADFQGHVAELLAKAAQQGKLDEAVTGKTRKCCCRRCASWGALDQNYRLQRQSGASERRGYAIEPGGGLIARAGAARAHRAVSDILKSRLWRYLQNFAQLQIPDHHVPAGRRHGHDRQGVRARGRRPHPLQCQGHGDPAGRSRRHRHAMSIREAPATPQTATADWCVCTIPLSILSQIPIEVGAPMAAAIDAVPYAGRGQDRPAVQAPLLGRGRGDLWRHQLHRSADPPDRLSQHRLQPARGTRRAARRLSVRGANAYEFTAMPPAERVARAVEFGARIHPQYTSRVRERRRGGLASRAIHARLLRRLVGGRRASSTTTICARSTAASCSPASTPPALPAWQEGAVLSALDAITRLHERVVRT